MYRFHSFTKLNILWPSDCFVKEVAKLRQVISSNRKTSLRGLLNCIEPISSSDCQINSYPIPSNVISLDFTKRGIFASIGSTVLATLLETSSFPSSDRKRALRHPGFTTTNRLLGVLPERYRPSTRRQLVCTTQCAIPAHCGTESYTILAQAPSR